MRHLFVVRNGVYDFDTERLKENSREYIGRLAQEMKYVCGEMRSGMFVITSPARHALETAEIIASAFGSEIREYDILLPNGEIPSLTDLGILNRAVSSHKKFNAVTMVTGIDIVLPYSHYFMRRYLNKGEELPKPRRGQAIHIDKTLRTYQLLPHDMEEA